MSDPRPAHPSFWEAFVYWLKLGFISFGGPAGQISMMHQELVEKRRWISERRFLHALNYCMVLPGPEAQQLAVYIGWLLHRTWGGIVAGTLFLLPSLFILSALTYVYLAYGNLQFVQGVFAGIKPAVVAIVVFAAWRIGSRALKNKVLWGLAAASFIAIFVFHVPFPAIVLGAGVLGFIGSKIAPDKFKVGGGHGGSGKDYGPALIDDDTPTPEHAKFKLSRLIFMTLAFVAVWAVGMGITLGFPVLKDMGEFFTKAALVTFGGAYAVLPYVYQGGVEHYQWLTGPQMMDGLALGETTPGPLIMVVAFVGFIGGWSKEVFGPDSLLLAGFAGACVATFFLPARLPVHPGRRPAGGGHPRRPQIHSAVDRHHRRRSRRDPQPGAVLRLACALAARQRSRAVLRWLRVVLCPDFHRRLPGSMEVQAGHHAGHRRLRGSGPGLHLRHGSLNMKWVTREHPRSTASPVPG